ncbi:MAG: NYN domain-containing protein [Thermomonas sp.]|uniref:NYN domain-containing protein n=1 Tax=Thermomonas sp. TaxID=1971895 RepID=UPI002624EE8D|nr:NYN domain-containing protein [Thermomonas sp.]MCC7096354.1 NYN domain-containing protein [Thermomonas sp.]
MSKNLKIALLIDADNASVTTLDYVLGEIADLGMANVRRAYGDWGNQSLKGWREALLANAIQPVQQIAYTLKGNASDMAMVIEAMDLLHGGDFDAFALMSSDSDFTPLVMRLRAANMLVYGFGKSQTPNAFKRACSVFFYVDVQDEPAAVETKAASATATTERSPPLPKPSAPIATPAIAKPAQAPIRRSGAELRSNTTLVNLLRNATEANDRDGWSHLGAVGHYLVNRNSFTPKNYGYANLKGLITAIDLFELHADGNHIRAKSADKTAKKAAKKAVTVVEQPTKN